MPKIIKYYRTNQYGVERQFVHPDNRAEALQIQFLTGKKTIDNFTKNAIKELSGGAVEFQEVIAP